MRVFVLSGQGGWITSPGILSLAGAIKELPGTEVTSHVWDDASVLPSVRAADGKVCVVGYSLGANQLGWLDRYAERQIDLGIAIDPSRLSPLVIRVGMEHVQNVDHYRRLVCFYNRGAWTFGGSRYQGPGVENIEVSGTHIGLQFDSDIRSRTLEEIRRCVQ